MKIDRLKAKVVRCLAFDGSIMNESVLVVDMLFYIGKKDREINVK